MSTHSCTYMYCMYSANTCIECMGQICANLHLKGNTTGVIMKPFIYIYTRNHKQTDEGKHTLTHVQTLRNSGSVPEHRRHCLCIASREEVYSDCHSDCHGQLPFLQRSAHYIQSTTVNIYSPPEEMRPTAKTNHFTAPAAWLIRHICLSFSQA